MPQIPFLDRVLQLPVVLQRRVGAVQTVQKPEIPPCSSSTFTCPLCALTGAGDGPDSAEIREVSARVLGQGSCPSLCNDRCQMVETVQKTVESPQLVVLLDWGVDVPVLATSRGCRGSAVAVHRLVWQLIMAMMSS